MSQDKNQRPKPAQSAAKSCCAAIKRWWRRGWRRKILAAGLMVVILSASFMYGVARWYAASQSEIPLEWGVTFIPAYAEHLGVDPQETMDAIITDLSVKRFRLVSYWNQIEKEQGTYDFDQLDWQFDKVEQISGDVSLAIGLRQPRWPECHMPPWAEGMEKEEWYPQLLEFIEAVVTRYKDSPALVSYQLENEFHLEAFGECPDHDRERLIEEFELVKKLDPDNPVIITRSNNLVPSWPVGKPRADKVGAAIYRRTWGTPLGIYIKVPFPSWYYAFLAGATKITTERDSFVHELQAEPWLPDGMDMASAPLEEQDRSMNADILIGNLEFAKKTGMRPIDIWGVEWWYARLIVHNDPDVWEAGRNFLKDQ